MRTARSTPLRRAWVPLILASLAAMSASLLPHAQPAAAAPDSSDPPAPPPLPWPAPASPPTTNAGYLAGSGGISLTGDYRYSIPIEAPRGRAGMEPNLSLNYSSRGGNGYLGVGWSLDYGGSEITRCAKTFNIDDTTDSPNYDTNDALCLDGQRLMKVGGLPMADGAEYRTYQDTFARIVAHGSQNGAPASFEVFAKDGTIKKYTALSAQRIADDALVSTVTPVWVLTEERDRNGNAVFYKYDVTSETSAPYAFEYRLATIEYTARRGDDGTLLESPNRSVELLYVARTDPSFHYRSGVRHEISRRLHAISLFAPNPEDQGLVEQYWFTYENVSDERTYLSAVKRDDPTHSTGPKERRFEWHHATRPEFEVHELEQFNAGYDNLVHYLVDVDADGTDDLILGDKLCRTAPGETPPFQSCEPSLNMYVGMPADLDGNGQVELPGPDGYVSWNPLTATFEPVAFGNAVNTLKIDFNGDGRIDAFEKKVIFDPGWDIPLYEFSLLRNDGTQLVPANGAFNPGGFGMNAPSYETPPAPVVMDLNGDGRGELHVAYNEHPNPGSICAEADYNWGWRYKAFGLNGGAYSPKQSTYVQGSPCKSVLIDLNGDGLKDKLYLAGPDSEVSYNTATGFAPAEPFATDIFPRLGKHDFEVVDIDGDGREDLISSREASSFQGQDHLPSTYLHIQRNDGLYRIDLGPSGVPAFDPDGLPQGLEPESPIIKTGDLNGDGLQDLVVLTRAKPYAGSVGYRKLQALVQTWAPNDVIHRVWDEDNVDVPRETVFYSAAPTHSPSSPTCQYPSRCIRGGMLTAREHWVHRQDAPGAIRSTSYEFDDPRMDLRGRGFLGFGTVRVTDNQTKAETTLLFDHQTAEDGRYPFAGVPTVAFRVVPILPESPDPTGGVMFPPSGSQITARVSSTRELQEMRLLNDGLTYAVFPTDSTVEEWEQHVTVGQSGLQLQNDGSETPHRIRRATRVFDDFGNETSADAWTIGGQRCHSKVTYDNLLTDWLIGLQRTTEATCNTDGAPLPEARLSSMDYDARGQLEVVTVEPNHPELKRTTTYSRDEYGLVTKATEGAAGEPSRKTYLAYDEDHVFVRATWNDLGHYSQQLIHPALGVPLVGQDPNGVQVHYEYDRLGRLVEVRPDDAVSTSIRYESDPDLPWAILVKRASDDGSQSQVRIDEWGRTLGSTYVGFDGDWIHDRTQYNRFGRATKHHRPAKGQASSLTTDIVFDTLGRTVSVVEPDGSTTTAEHAMFETITTDAEGRQSRVTRDIDDRIIESASHDGDQWVGMTYLYGAWNQIEDVVDPAGNVLHSTYDKLGRRFLLDDPDRGTTMWTYNAFGEVTTELDALGDTTTLARDILGRVTWKMHDQNGITTFNYDGNNQPGEIGRLTSASSPDGVDITYRYDELGHNTRTTWQVGTRTYKIERKFDDLGRVETIRYPEVPGRDRFVVRREYSPHGYAEKLYDQTIPGDLSKPIWEVKERNEDGLLRTSLFPNGIAETRQFDPATGRLTNIEAVKQGSALYAVHYQRDLTGNILERHDYAPTTPRIETFRYDRLDRLEEWTVQHANEQNRTSYTYDLIGNLKTVSGSSSEVHHHDGVLQNGSLQMPHALTARAVGGQLVTYGYDARGRQISGGGRTTSYKPFDLPAEIEQNGLTTTFSYDAFGQRTRKERTLVGASSPVDGVDTIDGLYERRWKGNSPSRHVFYVHGTDGPVAQVVYDENPNEAEKVLYLHQEALGSIGLITDNQGDEVERTYFDPFGAKTDAWGHATSPEMEDVKLGFTGHRHDDELGLVDMKGRIYDPAQKRFLTPDPFVPSPLFGQSYNRYSYVLNNPLRYTDPTGYQEAPPGQPPLVAPTSPEGLNVPEGKPAIIEVTAIDKPRKPPQSDADGFKKSEEKPIDPPPPPTREEQKARWWGTMKHFLWGATKQAFSSLPPVAAVRQIGHNLQIAGTAITQAMNGDLSLAGNTILELPQQMAEGAAGFLLGAVEAGLSLPATINTVINSPDPEARGAAAVSAVQKVATVAATLMAAGGPKGTSGNGPKGSLVRFGKGPESAASLAADAAKAEANGFPHGVSTKLVDRVSGSDKAHRSALVSDVQQQFPVQQTGRNPAHHTVHLPKPITQAVADAFNALFK